MPSSLFKALRVATKTGYWMGKRSEYRAIVKLFKEEIAATKEIGGHSREYTYGMEHMLFLLEGEADE